LEQVVAQDSRFAPAWALLAFAYAATPGFDSAWFRGVSEELRRVANASLPRAEEAARRAIELDPNLADGYLPLALAQHVRGKLLEAEQLYSKALALDPNNPDVLHLYSQLLAKVGHLKDALTMRQLTDGYPLIVFMDTRGLIHVNRIWSFKGDAPHALERILRYCIAAPLVRGLVVMIDAVPFLSELGDKFLDHFRRQQLLLD
jgi:tetratricopeptide (TPR) repeat protein